MRIKPKLRRDLITIGLIGLAWTVVIALLDLYEKAYLSDDIASIMKTSESDTSLAYGLIGGLIIGLVLGTFLVLYYRNRFRKASYAASLGILAAFFVVVFFLGGATLLAVYFSSSKGIPIFSAESFRLIGDLMFGPFVMVNLLISTLVLLGIQLLLNVSDKFGQGVLWKMIRGKYHRPKEERRIFMFLDMRSSTTIAERIGHKQYFALLNDLFADMTDAIVNTRGELYQYVGDEVVISWPVERGLQNANCLQCFYAIGKELTKRKAKYTEKYGLLPEFKAGLHFGNIMMGEVGILKKDIVFSGDVLNTTARIQAECNAAGVNILLSLDLADALAGKGFAFRQIGNILLRGKEEELGIVTVSEAG